MGEKSISLNLEDAGKAMVWLDVLADLTSGRGPLRSTSSPTFAEEVREGARRIGEKLDAARGVEKTRGVKEEKYTTVKFGR